MIALNDDHTYQTTTCPLHSRRRCSALAWVALLSATAAAAFAAPPEASHGQRQKPDVVEANPRAGAELETRLVRRARQLTFEGRRAGEGYFNPAGSQMVFQSEREPGNPFFQIYLMDLETGDVQRISPGHGKTTCAWLHPDSNKVLFSSTHEDEQARAKQAAEIEQRKAGKSRRYSWDYDEHYEIYVFDRKARSYTTVTDARGYDAEGSFSPDGRLIAFASNRLAYSETMSDEQQKLFDHDPATMMDIYIMNGDGSNVRRLTTSAGYDGGPFFSPDGKQICWRRFATNGATAEIMTMNIDGSDQRRITSLGVMSWAPFYHPSGEYLIFTTNLHGFANFELYLVDAAGKAPPVRVTFTAGFDGLPVFTPDGKHLAWTTNRMSSGHSQIFLADFDHQQARKLLRLDRRRPPVEKAGTAVKEETSAATAAAAEVSRQTAPAFSADDLRSHVEYLCRKELAGRLTGTRGERLATAYVAAYFEHLGLKPGGKGGSWFQEFEFTAGATLGENNKLARGREQTAVDKDWRPVSFSATGKFPAAPIVFAGYGITAPSNEKQDGYDSFVHLDVADKWVLVFRYIPEELSAERRQHVAHYSGLRYKAMAVRDKGARGLIVVSGPNSKVKQQLVPMRIDGSLSGTSIPVISITDRLAQAWLESSGKKLADLQNTLDKGEPMMGFELEGEKLSASIDVRQVKRTGRNVLARLQAGPQAAGQVVVIGAHVDHLGTGESGASLARDGETGKIHFGADDNASGVAALMEIAEYLADQHQHGNLRLRRDVLFAAWSGEEVGTLGSNHFIKTLGKRLHGKSNGGKLYPAVNACLNMDMVGRFQKKLTLLGVGSSSVWPGEVERRNAPVGLPIRLQDDSYLPTDATGFFLRGVPILAAFTGSHGDYHTPRDTPEKLNYEDAARIARFMALITRSLAMRDSPPDYVAQAAPKRGARRGGLRAYLGTIPDYAEADVKGVKLQGASKGGPADKAGVQAGDVVVELAGRKIDNIYDYTYAIEALKIGQVVKIVVLRGGERIEMNMTPGSRE